MAVYRNFEVVGCMGCSFEASVIARLSVISAGLSHKTPSPEWERFVVRDPRSSMHDHLAGADTAHAGAAAAPVNGDHDTLVRGLREELRRVTPPPQPILAEPPAPEAHRFDASDDARTQWLSTAPKEGRASFSEAVLAGDETVLRFRRTRVHAHLSRSGLGIWRRASKGEHCIGAKGRASTRQIRRTATRC